MIRLTSCSDVLPIETTLRVWDCLFYEGSKILLRVAVALVAMNSSRILEARDFTTLANREETFNTHYSDPQKGMSQVV